MTIKTIIFGGLLILIMLLWTAIISAVIWDEEIDDRKRSDDIKEA